MIKRLGSRATLKLFADADHSFHVRKRSGQTDGQVLTQMVDALAVWDRYNLIPYRTSQLTQVGRRQIGVSNLGKLLYPANHVSKAEVLNYYLTLAPTILAHLKGRPLTVVRLPEGIDGQAFFQKTDLNGASHGLSMPFLVTRKPTTSSPANRPHWFGLRTWPASSFTKSRSTSHPWGTGGGRGMRLVFLPKGSGASAYEPLDFLKSMN